MTVLEKSPNWDRYKDSSGPISEGFPFNEGFPSAYNSGKLYTLIFADGNRIVGKPDYSRTYYAEGTRWTFVETPHGFGLYGCGKHVIVAWCELETSQQGSIS